MSDQKQIFYQLLQGDESALKLLLSQYHNYLMVVGLRYLTDRQRVQDVIHDLYSDLWNSKKEIEINCGVKSFLRGAVINKCLAIIRKDSRVDLVEEHAYDLAETAAAPDQLIDRDNLKKTINEIVSGLPDKCRQVFELSRYEGKSHKEISEEMGISKKTIENHMTRALRTLRNELKRRELLIIIITLIKMNI